MKIKYDKIEQAIAGDNTALSTAFNWAKTPQGDRYWRDQFRGRTGLDIDALKAMRKKPDTPKLWSDMTDAEKGELLLANHEGKPIEAMRTETTYPYDISGKWLHWTGLFKPEDNVVYRIKPTPVVETVVLHGRNYITKTYPNGVWDFDRNEVQIGDTHRITFKTIDGEPDTASIKMEKL